MPGPRDDRPPLTPRLPAAAQATVGTLATLGTNVATAQAGAAIGGTSGIASGTGWEIQGIAAFLNLVAQDVKRSPRVNQDRWIIPLLLLLGMAIAYLVWREVVLAVLNGALAAWQAHLNYKTLNATGIQVLSPAADPTADPPPSPARGGSHGKD